MRDTMSVTKLKEKGQITLPVDVRREINAQKGDIFDVQVDNGKVIMTLQRLVPVNEELTTVDLSRFIGSASNAFGSVQEIDDNIRKDRDSWD